MAVLDRDGVVFDDLLDFLSRIELHRPSVKIAEPRLAPPNLVQIFIDGQEPNHFFAQYRADKHVFVAPIKVAAMFYST